jgi:hypothetical protein
MAIRRSRSVMGTRVVAIRPVLTAYNRPLPSSAAADRKDRKAAKLSDQTLTMRVLMLIENESGKLHSNKKGSC